jgi:histone-lysine N-methyltransferase SETMAR
MDSRVAIAKANLRLADKDPDFLDRLITVDETWLHHYDPLSKEQSKQWLPRGSNPPLKAKVVPSAGKVMATLYWDSKGVIHVDYLDQGATINAKYYSHLLKNEVRNALRRNRPGKLSGRPLLLHDNARPHTAKKTMKAIGRLGWELLPHPPYSPDLAPSDYYLFPRMKEYLRGNHFASNEDLKKEVERWLRQQDETFYTRGLEKLFDRYEKCIELGGAYIEKCSVANDND